MAHHDYPVGWTSPVSLGHAPGVVEYELLWDQVVASINGDTGGTWAPSAWVTVGGSGFQFTGTGHTLADGGRIRLAGTGSGDAGKIDLKVVSGVALIDAENGSAIRIKAGASLDVFGTLAAKSGSASTWESGATATLASGATLSVSGTANFNSGSTTTFASGSTANLNGTTNVRGAITLKSSGGPGGLSSESGTAILVGGSITFDSTCNAFHTSGSTVNGLITRQGREVRSGSSARTAHRAPLALPGNTDADVTVAHDRCDVPAILTGNRLYTLRHTGTVPVAYERIKASRIGPVTPSPSYSAKFQREDGTILYSFYNGKQGCCEFEFDGTDWQCVAGVQYATASQSGYYDDVW